MKSHSHSLQREMQTFLDDLNYDFSQFTIADFVTWLENEKGRKIKIIPWAVPASMSGAWISTPDDYDYIFYDESAAVWQQQHIQLNHLARILLEHKTLQVNSASADNLADLEKIAFRGQMTQLSQQTLSDMVRYVLKNEG